MTPSSTSPLPREGSVCVVLSMRLKHDDYSRSTYFSGSFGSGGSTTLLSAPSIRGLVGQKGTKISGGFWQVS